MKIAHVTACYQAADGVGNTIHEKVEASLAAGDDVRIFVERGADPVPAAHAPLATHLDLADLLDERAGGPAAGFFEADVHLFQLLHPYPLMRGAHLLDRGALLFEYPGFTPAEHYRHEEHFRRLQADLGAAFATMGLADAVLVHSRSMRRELCEMVPGAEERVRVLRLSVNSDGLDGGRAGRSPLARAGGPRLLYVGRFAGNKRLDLLLRAFAGLRREHPGATLHLVGDREAPAYAAYGAEVDALARELGVAGAVRSHGRLPDAALADAYADADLLVTASLHEGFCLPAAEALYCGVPVVGYATTALPEVVEDGGVLAEDVGEPGSLQAAMAAALAGREALAARARARGAQYSRAAFRRRYRDLLEEFGVHADRPRVAGRRELLEALKDTPVHYADRCDWPVVGGVVSAARRRATLHFEKFYVRKMQRMQNLFNDLLLEELDALRARVRELEAAAAGAAEEDGARERDAPGRGARPGREES